MDQVADNLWISDITDVREESMGSRGIKKVITVCQDSVEDNVGCKYSYYCMSDGVYDGYGGDNSFELYQKAADDLYQSVHGGTKTLIHCHMGQSRSVSVAAGALGRLKNISFEEAFDIIESRRPQAHPDSLLKEHAIKYIKMNQDEQT